MSVNPEKASVKVTNLKKKTTPQVTGVNPDGSFKLEIKPGDYQVLVSHAGYQTDTVLLNIPLYFQSHKIVLNPELTPEQVVTGTFLTIKNVLFDFDSYALDDQAKSGLEAIKPIVFSYPDLKMEVAGYTDPKGSAAYNLKLADNRAQSVIDYLSSTGIPASSFVKKAFGESNFAAINTNSDGSDNPEGRKYNRRVTFGIVDPHSGIVIRQESFTPEHLRLISSIKYSVVLKKSNEKLLPGYFNNLMLNGLMFIRTLPTDAGFVYSIGVFYSKQDADKYLAYAKEKGFQDAYIVDYYELNK
ncbi:MAG: OmpA family protein [Bacteroidia bacterium]|nr:OmpA family protein [Bacteroidia bacterium]